MHPRRQRLLEWHYPVTVKQAWRRWVNKSYEITTNWLSNNNKNKAKPQSGKFDGIYFSENKNEKYLLQSKPVYSVSHIKNTNNEREAQWYHIFGKGGSSKDLGALSSCQRQVHDNMWWPGTGCTVHGGIRLRDLKKVQMKNTFRKIETKENTIYSKQ